MLDKVKILSKHLVFGVFISSIFWALDWGYSLLYNLSHADFYYQSWHAPALIFLLGAFAVIAAIVITKISSGKTGKKSNISNYRMISYYIAIIITGYYLFTVFNFKIISMEVLDLASASALFDLNRIMGNIIVIFILILVFPGLKYLTERLNSNTWILKSVIIIMILLLERGIGILDPNGYNLNIGENEFVAKEERENYPNVLIIVIDCLRSDYVGCYGSGMGLTPNLDKIAGEGALFLNHYSDATWTAPGFASIYTGLSPYKVFYRQDLKLPNAESEKRHNFVPANEIPGEIPTIPSIFSYYGYETVTFQPNINAGSIYNYDRGSNLFLECSNRMKYTPVVYLTYDYTIRVFRKLYDNIPLINEYEKVYKKHNAAKGGKLEKYIRNSLSDLDYRPFLYIVNFMDVHEYINRMPDELIAELPNSNESDTLKVGYYKQNLAYADYYIGKIYENLRETGLLDSTILVITSDHGEQFMEHNYYGHGYSVYNEEIKVPLIIRYPQEIAAGQIFTKLTSNRDILPTLENMCFDSAAVLHGDGVDLFGEADTARIIYSGYTVYTKDKYALMYRNWKLIYDTKAEEYSLYDLVHDPGEKSPMDPSVSEIGVKLAAEMDKHLKDIAETQETLRRKNQISEKEVKVSVDTRDLRALGYTK